MTKKIYIHINHIRHRLLEPRSNLGELYICLCGIGYVVCGFGIEKSKQAG